MYRKVKLTVKTKDLEKVLSNLKFSEEFNENTTQTFIAEIEDVKSNYEYLAKSEDVFDWDFYSEENENSNKECNNCNIEDCDKKHSIPINPFNKLLDLGNSLITPNNNDDDKEVKKIVDYFIMNLGVNKISDLETILSDVHSKINRFSRIYVESTFSVDFFEKHIFPTFKLDENSDIILRKFITAYYNDFSVKDATTNLISSIKKNWEHIKSCSSVQNLIWLMFGKDTQEVVELLMKFN